MRHYNIPVFIPELACPFRCTYCNQYNISGKCRAPDTAEVQQIIENHLATIPADSSHVELAFFGGSFTGLSLEQQNMYLDIAAPYLKQRRLQGIRISTRPDYISAPLLENLRKKGVCAIELGAQSLDDEVLKAAGRGHTADDVEKAALLIKEYGFELGLQMMVGLPGDTPEKCILTAEKIIALNADTTRIYPTLVINNTDLASTYRRGDFKPLTLDEAAEQCAILFRKFLAAGVKVLRMGLHPSESFYDGESLLAGPFHPAFGEWVMSRFWHHNFEEHIKMKKEGICVTVHPSQLNAAIGHKASNKSYLQQKFSQVKFKTNPEMEKYGFKIDFY